MATPALKEIARRNKHPGEPNQRLLGLGSVRLLVVELEDGSERSPAAASLYWPA